MNLQISRDASQPALVKVRNLFVLGPVPPATLPAGADAPVYAVIVSGTADRLLSVVSPEFTGGALITGGGIDLPAGKAVPLDTGHGSLVVLKGLREPTLGGKKVQLILRFQRAGTTTVTVQLVARQAAFSTLSPAPAGSSPR